MKFFSRRVLTANSSARRFEWPLWCDRLDSEYFFCVLLILIISRRSSNVSFLTLCTVASGEILQNYYFQARYIFIQPRITNGENYLLRLAIKWLNDSKETQRSPQWLQPLAFSLTVCIGTEFLALTVCAGSIGGEHCEWRDPLIYLDAESARPRRSPYAYEGYRWGSSRISRKGLNKCIATCKWTTILAAKRPNGKPAKLWQTNKHVI